MKECLSSVMRQDSACMAIVVRWLACLCGFMRLAMDCVAGMSQDQPCVWDELGCLERKPW
jgi:hypothetical protein